MADIFISYARENREQAQALADLFKNSGWTVFLDTMIRGGAYFPSIIEHELANARCVVVLWSSFSVKSQWVLSEASDAVERNLLLPVLLEDIRLPLRFRLVQGISLVGVQLEKKGAEVDQLVNSVADLLEGSRDQSCTSVLEPSAEQRSPVKSRAERQPRTMLVVRVVSGLVITALIILLFKLEPEPPARRESNPADAAFYGRLAYELEGQINKFFQISGDPGRNALHLLCAPSEPPESWQLKSVTGLKLTFKRDRTPRNAKDNESRSCSPFEDCASKPWRYDVFESSVENIAVFQPCE